jgi:hypothetical protein
MAFDYLFNRTKKCYKVIKLPESLPSETYGLKGCCDKLLVLAGGTNDWQNDKSSAYFKLQTNLDNVTFVLKNVDGNTIYQPTKKQCPNDSLAYYSTIDWKNVLASDGVGCYYLEVNYQIVGVIGSFIWAEYDLKQYSTDNAKGTIRLKAIFNQFNKIENINFIGSNMVDTLRLGGFFGKRQPNTQIDNLIYQNREIYNVRRENLNVYELKTDFIKVNYTRKILDFYILSESDLYISDHTPFNHTSEYKNLAVSISETPDVVYAEESNLAQINCKFNDKKRDKLTSFL